MSNIYTMTEIVGITGLSERTIRRYIKSGLLQAEMSRQGRKTFTTIKRQELERFLKENNIPLSDNSGQGRRTVADKSTILPDNSGQDSSNDIKTLIKEAIQEQQSAIMKPMEQQALFLAGKYQAENSFLLQQVETLRIENDQLMEKFKALPLDDLTEENKKLKEDLSQEMEQKKKLQEQISILPDSPLNVNKILMQNSENLKAIMKEKEEIHKELQQEQEEKNKKQYKVIYLEEELKKVQEQAEEMRQKLSRPWYKFW